MITPAGKGGPAVDAASAERQRRWLGVRLGITGVVMTSLFAAIGWKAWAVQIDDGERMRQLGERQHLRELELAAPRGSLLDRHGAPLAISIEVQSVFIRPRETDNPEGTVRAVARVLQVDPEPFLAKVAAGKRFFWMKRRMTPAETEGVRALNLRGVGLTPEAKRFYPAGELAGTVLGTAGLDGHGLDGLEKSLDAHLLGSQEKHQVLRDARGQVLFDSGWEEDEVAAQAGDTVVLTIDRYVQYVAERALVESVTSHKATAGVAVVLDARTAEVLAMASLPTFDPNASGDRAGARNRVVTDAYEPGSGMKVFTVASALEAGVIRADEGFAVDGGRIQVGKKTIRDVHYEKPILSVSEIIQTSSNVGAVKVARRLGKDAMAAGLRAFGFGSATGIELPGERDGLLRDVRRWGEIGLATGSFGYGMLVTPLQIAAALCSIASGGVWRAPTIVREVRGADGQVTWAPERRERRVLSEANARAMIGMMETVMQPGGTGEKLRVPGFRVAGKTGTAHKVDPRTKKYSANTYLSSFIGIAPADDPRIVVVVMIDEPNGDAHYGGVVAGPVFVDIANEVLPYLGVAADPELVAQAEAEKAAKAAKAAARAGKGAKPAKPAPSAVVATADEVPPLEGDADELAEGDVPPAGPGEAIVVIPDFTGMSVTQAVAAAHAAGVKLEPSGSGRAVRQFPPPGRAVKSITCQVTFQPR